MTTDVFTPEKRSAVMRRVKGRDTGPEMAVRRALRALGVGYRLGGENLPGRPDVVMKGRRAIIFVHGCFWHGHDCARGAREPKANADYWRAKIGGNRERDRASEQALTLDGWRVLILWECDLKDTAVLETRLRVFLSPQAASVSRAASART
ncbi:very short patch repair endonuclease [Brevundimonas sp.]|uniref:very short patch repair endonuclease n=1 Tax=Brevundimonas sp. TaxID=1871086 RepID=UPI00391A7BFF